MKRSWLPNSEPPERWPHCWLERAERNVEAHDADVHLRAHREIVHVGGVPRLAALGAIEAASVARFGSLVSEERAGA